MKKNDYIILSIICFFLGIFLVSQFYASQEAEKLTQPENNAVLALEVGKLTKSNAALRSEVNKLTHNLDTYKSSSASRQNSFDQYLRDTNQLDIINGDKVASGQGVLIKVNGTLNTPQIVDLINAVKNIGYEIISINNMRLVANTEMSQFSGVNHYDIKVLGNSQVLKSAMERKGGIVEQISSQGIQFNIEEKADLEIPAGQPIRLFHSKIIH